MSFIETTSLLTFAKCFITVPFCSFKASSSFRALHFIAIIAGKQARLVGNEAATYHVSIRWGLDSLARKPLSKKVSINIKNDLCWKSEESLF